MDSAGHAVTLAKNIPTFLDVYLHFEHTYIFWIINWTYILYDISTSGVKLDKTITRQYIIHLEFAAFVLTWHYIAIVFSCCR